MKLEMEIWDNKTNSFVMAIVTLKRSKGFKKIFDHARKNIITEFGKTFYSPYWLTGLDIDNKDWFIGGWYSDNHGLINLSLNGENVQGVVLDGNKLFLLESVKLK